MRKFMGVVLLFAACGGGSDGPVPTCQVAVAHFYEAGCKFQNLETGADYTQGEWTAICRDALANAPASCVDDFDDFRVCMNEVPSPATSNSDCDCSAEQEALLTCE